MQIIILGMHRSGTSLTTRMVNMMGAYVGGEGAMLNFDRDNPKGYWERKDLIQCDIAILKLYNASWPNIANWPLPHKPAPLPETLWHSMRTLILRMDAHRPWVMKDPRLCITLPYWKPMLEVPVCVIVYRDPMEIARSLHLRERSDSLTLERGLALWEFYAASALNASADLPRVYVSHTDFLRDPVETTEKLYDDLVAQGVQGLRLPSAREITAFVDPSLYRSKPKAEQLESMQLSEHQQSLVAMMKGEYRAQGNLSVSEESKKHLQQPIITAYP